MEDLYAARLSIKNHAYWGPLNLSNCADYSTNKKIKVNFLLITNKNQEWQEKPGKGKQNQKLLENHRKPKK